MSWTDENAWPADDPPDAPVHPTWDWLSPVLVALMLAAPLAVAWWCG